MRGKPAYIPLDFYWGVAPNFVASPTAAAAIHLLSDVSGRTVRNDIEMDLLAAILFLTPNRSV